VIQNRLTDFCDIFGGLVAKEADRPTDRRIKNVQKLRIEKVMPLTNTHAAEEEAGTEDVGLVIMACPSTLHRMDHSLDLETSGLRDLI
jgi:hypothetical protein